MGPVFTPQPAFWESRMKLTDVECRSFRCLEEVCFSPGPGLNIIRGGNAQGKTSVLEGILFAATSKSHRTNNESELARHGEEAFHLKVSGGARGARGAY